MAIGSHQRAKGKSNEWLTPPYILKALGSFDLDPCAPIKAPWPTAKKHFNYRDDGLAQKWEGRIWCNPPYGLKAAKWLRRMAEHGNGIALVFARTETEMFEKFVWNGATGVFFFFGRLHFHHPNGKRAKANAGGPSCLVAYGTENLESIRRSGLKGITVSLVENGTSEIQRAFQF